MTCYFLSSPHVTYTSILVEANKVEEHCCIVDEHILPKVIYIACSLTFTVCIYWVHPGLLVYVFNSKPSPWWADGRLYCSHHDTHISQPFLNPHLASLSTSRLVRHSKFLSKISLSQIRLSFLFPLLSVHKPMHCNVYGFYSKYVLRRNKLTSLFLPHPSPRLASSLTILRIMGDLCSTVAHPLHID